MIFVSGMLVGSFFTVIIMSLLSTGAYRKGDEDARTKMEFQF